MRQGRAAVIGAGVAGLGAAAALSPHLHEVVVFDKDRLPTDLVGRKGVPQGEHIHILLEAGVRSLEELLPGIRGELVKAGSASIRAGTGQQLFAFGRWYPERDLGFDFLGQSRPLLEGVLRRRVAALPNVELRAGTRVIRLALADGRVVGVVLADGEHEREETFELVVDATGVAGKFARVVLPKDLPIEQHVTDVYYSTVHFEKPPNRYGYKENILITSDNAGRRVGGSLIDVEMETWCVSLHGRSAEGQPGDMQEWLALAASLPDGRISDRIRGARPLGVPRAYRKATALFRRFDRIAERVPLGYLPAGDTIASYNPIFGQGMTVAFGHAVALHRALAHESDLSTLRALYLPAAARWSTRAWRNTTMHDLAYSAASESQQSAARALRSLAEARQEKAMNDVETHRQIVLASQMLDIPGVSP